MPFVTRSFTAGELIAQKYLLLHLLGRGASGEVFRARNILAGNALALKFLIDEPGRDSELVQRFFREARAINRIGHPNIVSVFDAGYADAIPYIAMEYLGGESLAQVLDRIPKLPFACVAAILLQVLDALTAAHKADIVHRDLKPANIFLQACAGATPKVKLLDFGVAKIHEDGELSIKTESGMILGTPDYLSPEQITGDGEVDGRSDLFAAGSLMFELLTGRRPFHGPTFVTTTYRIVHEPEPSLAESGGPDDPAVAQILARALCKKRDERFASAAEFASHLEKIAPEASVREAALRDLDVHSPSGFERWDMPIPLTPPMGIETVLPATRGDTSKRFLAEPKVTAQSSPARAESAPRKLSRTWSELPIVGRRRGSQAAVGSVRGTVLLAMDRAIATRYGGDVREEIVNALPRETRDIFRAGAPSAEAWYSLPQIVAYLKSSNQIAVHDDGERWRALGYAGVETDLLTLLRSVRNQTDGYVALRAALPIFSGLFDFGRWSLEGVPQSLRIEAMGFARTPPSLHDWLAGVIEHAARSTGRPYRVAVLRGAADVEDAAIEFTATLAGYTD
jgi:serine/threonine protein kinase